VGNATVVGRSEEIGVPNRARLTERLIATAALAIVDAHGIDALTMRRLAAELGTTPMALYNHFPDKDGVLEAVAQLVLAEIEAPADPAGWQEAVTTIMRSARETALRHPHAAPLIARFPPRTPDALAFVEAGFRAFRAAGFDPAATAMAYRILAAYSLGSQQIELTDYFAAHPAAKEPDGSLDAGSRHRFLPTVEEVGPHLAVADSAQDFERGLKLLVTGLARLLPGPSTA
jgi:AcrR family transcriptional regulator